MTEYKLIKYRDAQMKDYIWFWVNDQDERSSPAYNTEEDAMKWNMQDEWDNWKSIKEFV